MAFEIERRFLIKNDNWKEFINKKVYIEQGYFSKSLDGKSFFPFNPIGSLFLKFIVTYDGLFGAFSGEIVL